MPTPIPRIYFDFVDPLCYLVAHLLGQSSAEWIGFELRPPPAVLTWTADPLWAERWQEARARAAELDLSLGTPRLVPWTRKAHELHTYASLEGAGDAVRRAVFEAFVRDGRDIGRVDVLVDIAASAGLDRTATKAVLDVDRHESDVLTARDAARARGVSHVPAFWIDGRLVEGFPDPTDLGTLLPHR